ncbi:MAG: hypothetical protein ACXWKA_04005 [Xanthobacteraceae bacterium]
MQNRLTTFATAAFIGAAALAATSSAKAAHWAVVPDDDDGAYDSAYVVEPPATYIVPQGQIVTRPPAYVERQPQWRSGDGYITAGVYDNCTVYRGPGLFGGTYETRECH